MSDNEKVLAELRAMLRSEPRSGPQVRLSLDYDDGTLTIDGEVASVAVKKLLLERAAADPRVEAVVDRLRVEPAQPMGDGEIRDLVRNALLQEPALAEIAIRVRAKGVESTVRDPGDAGRGEICVTVEDGVVTLDGDAPSLAHKRLAGVLAWWVPGSRDVINALGVYPPEAPADAETTDSVRMALEKDPFVNASQIRVVTRDSVVLLEGLVPTESEREMAECDAWYVFGVDRVENRIEVRPVPPTGRYG